MGSPAPFAVRYLLPGGEKPGRPPHRPDALFLCVCIFRRAAPRRRNCYIIMQQTGIPFIIMQQVMPGIIIAFIQSQHACIIFIM